MKQTTIVTIILGVLVLVSIVQVVQLNAMKSKVTGGELSVGSGSTTTPAVSGGSGQQTASLPSSIKDLPTMVGGC
jgi:hypothetical protein